MRNNIKKFVEDKFQIPNNSTYIYILHNKDFVFKRLRRILILKREVQGKIDVATDKARCQSNA